LPGATRRAEILNVALGDLSKFWPDAINREIVELGLENAQCALPLPELGKSVPNGSVQLTWSQVRAWIHPAPTRETEFPQGETVVEIPLKFIASLTLAQGQASTPALPRKGQFGAKLPPLQTQIKSEPPATSPLPSAPPLPKAEPAKPAMLAGAGGKQILRLPISLVWKEWPEPLRRELSASQFAEASLEIPRQIVEPGLKTGKVEFDWKDLQEFLKPSFNGILAADFLDTTLALPLGVLVPLMFPNQQAAAPKRAYAADEIPDVFNAAGKIVEPPAEPTPPAPESAQPEPKPSETAAEAQPAPEVPQKEPQDLAELFGEPDKRNWTPNEIVHKTSLLPNVRGALIALQDGLLVASCMPPEWKTETIAAFLPQIFGRMNQYVKELKMGDLNCVHFTVEQGTLQIYNAGIIYFAALGHPGQPLPSSLNLIARELSRHTR
jgi:predicted regulator of Ras-like GTPase activity (Roadblock/LC7/MglB family)